MAWCASEQLTHYGDCNWFYSPGIPLRCTLCPLFDPKRASRASSPQTPAHKATLAKLPPRPEPAFNVIDDLDFLFNPELRALLDWQIPDWMDLSPLIPDFPPTTPEEPADQQDEPGEERPAEY
jgi:hypothetical protein